MTIIFLFVIASFVASTFVVSACVLSSRISRRENLTEAYEDHSGTTVPVSPQPFSPN